MFYRKQGVQEKFFHGKSYNNKVYVVSTRNRKPMIPRDFRKEFYNLTENIDLPNISFHDLRHTHATILLQENVNVMLILE